MPEEPPAGRRAAALRGAFSPTKGYKKKGRREGGRRTGRQDGAARRGERARTGGRGKRASGRIGGRRCIRPPAAG